MSITRNIIEKHLSIEDELIGKTIKESIDILNKYSIKYPNAILDIRGYDDSCLCLVWTEQEPIEEYEKRVKNWNKKKEKRRREYEKLKKEFESEE